MSSSKNINRAKKVLNIEARAILDLAKKIDKNFDRTINFLTKLKGRVIVTGMGKAGFIAQKISATLSSTGTPSLYLHPAEALHGDLGRVTKEDCLLTFSNSGTTEEVVKLLPIMKKIGVCLIAVVGNIKSTIARNADFVLDVSVKKEACSLGLAPTTSTTAMLAMGDALCVSLLDRKGFKEKDFAFYHPGGTLGKRLLLKVEDIMRRGIANPIVGENARVKDVLLNITKARAGSASVVNKAGRLSGIFTDGDLRRHLDTKINIANKKIKDIMTKSPTTIKKDRLAAEALQILRSKKIDEIPVVDDKKRPIGLLDVQDILKAGLV
ncbi:MAG: KpsF/GutQ family sugar-phosphate isomerase [Candidatus Omnitrophota bacterium]|nr:MAG: KpsF/GutQ family sugar-phosphate isomerase [Candidatus Omnitrophota bacterium]